LRDLVPTVAIVAVLGDPNYPGFDRGFSGVLAAGRALGWRIVAEKAATEREFEPAFANFAHARADALLVSGSPFFTSQRRTLIALAARHAIPAIYDLREFVVDGGLMSYSASIAAAYRQAGVYTGRIIKGAKPSDLPVMQPTTFELAINLKTAKALGLTVPPSIHLRADEVIE
jgi:putative ABC transport system substrate-binding protein